MTTIAALLGASDEGRISLTGGVFTGTGTAPFTPAASFALINDGTVVIGDDISSTRPPWCVPAFYVPRYEILATLTGGTNPTTGPMGAWTSLSATVAWQITRPTIGTNTSTFQLDIRLASSGVIVATTSVQLTAQKF